MARRLLALAGLATLLTACGSTAHRSACTSPKVERALARINADIAAIRRAAALPTHDSFKGSPRINHATDVFLRDVELAPLDNLQRNRLIDHAAAALAGACTQCFQALEAERPVISIHLAHPGAACHGT